MTLKAVINRFFSEPPEENTYFCDKQCRPN